MGYLSAAALTEVTSENPSIRAGLHLGPIGGTTYRWSPVNIPLASATYGPYDDRVLSFGTIYRAVSEDRASLQGVEMDVLIADDDGTFERIIEGQYGLSVPGAAVQVLGILGIEATDDPADWPVVFDGVVKGEPEMLSAKRWKLRLGPDDAVIDGGRRPLRRFTVADFPGILQEHVGKVIPSVLGVKNSWQGRDKGACPLFWVGNVGSYTNCAVVCMGGATYVPRVYVDGATIASAGNYDVLRVTINGTRFTLIDFAIDRSESTLTCDVYGLSDSVASSGYVGPNDGNGSLILNPITAFRRFMAALVLNDWREGEFPSEASLNLSDTYLDEAEAFAEARQYRVGKWLGEPRKPVDWINELAEDVWAKVFWTWDGKIAMRFSDPARTTLYVSDHRWIRWEQDGEETRIAYRPDSRLRVQGYAGKFAFDDEAGDAVGLLTVKDAGLPNADIVQDAERAWSELAPPFEAGFFGTIAGCDLWCEARLLSAALNPGDAVTTVNDESENGYSMTSAGGARPTLLAGRCYGRPVLDFDGTDDYLTSNASFVASDVWAVGSKKAIVVFRADAIAAAAANMDDNAALICDDSGLFGVHVYQSGGLYYVAGYNYDGSRDSVSVQISLATWYVVRVWHVSGTLYISLNGGLPTSTASGNTTSLAAVVIVGRNRSAAPVFFNGQAAAWMCFSNGEPRNEDGFAIMSGIADEYGLTVVV